MHGSVLCLLRDCLRPFNRVSLQLHSSQVVQDRYKEAIKASVNKQKKTAWGHPRTVQHYNVRTSGTVHAYTTNAQVLNLSASCGLGK